MTLVLLVASSAVLPAQSEPAQSPQQAEWTQDLLLLDSSIRKDELFWVPASQVAAFRDLTPDELALLEIAPEIQAEFRRSLEAKIAARYRDAVHWKLDQDGCKEELHCTGASLISYEEKLPSGPRATIAKLVERSFATVVFRVTDLQPGMGPLGQFATRIRGQVIEVLKVEARPAEHGFVPVRGGEIEVFSRDYDLYVEEHHFCTPKREGFFQPSVGDTVLAIGLPVFAPNVLSLTYLFPVVGGFAQAQPYEHLDGMPYPVSLP